MKRKLNMVTKSTHARYGTIRKTYSAKSTDSQFILPQWTKKQR